MDLVRVKDEFDSIEEALKKLSFGTIDALVVDVGQGSFYTTDYGITNLKTAGDDTIELSMEIEDGLAIVSILHDSDGDGDWDVTGDATDLLLVTDEDGDFDIPSVYMTEEEGKKLINAGGETVQMISRTKRIHGDSYQVIAKKGQTSRQRVVVTAHIDAKKGTPGAIDNATGVIVLMLLAELLTDYSDQPEIELVAFNGEDYFAASGQTLYLNQNQTLSKDVLFNINIDGAGYHIGG